MIYDIDYLSSSRFEAMTGDPQTAVVSITDPGGSDARVPAGFGPVLRLKLRVGRDYGNFGRNEIKVLNFNKKTKKTARRI